MEAQREHRDIRTIKESLCKSRIVKLSEDGNPQVETLEGIRMEFEEAMMEMAGNTR